MASPSSCSGPHGTHRPRSPDSPPRKRREPLSPFDDLVLSAKVLSSLFACPAICSVLCFPSFFCFLLSDSVSCAVQFSRDILWTMLNTLTCACSPSSFRFSTDFLSSTPRARSPFSWGLHAPMSNAWPGSFRKSRHSLRTSGQLTTKLKFCTSDWASPSSGTATAIVLLPFSAPGCAGHAPSNNRKPFARVRTVSTREFPPLLLDCSEEDGV